MPPIGIHGLIGLFLARKTRTQIKGDPTAVHQGLFLGLICGSMVPDIDLFVVFLSALVRFLILQEDLYSSIDNSIWIHRSLTHSLIFIGSGGIIILLLAHLMRWRNIFFTTAGLFSAMTIHAILDLFYLTGVYLFYPLGDRILILPFDVMKTSESLQKIIAGLDMFLFDGIFYYYLYLALRKQNPSHWINRLKFLSVLTFILAAVFFLLALTSITIDVYLAILYFFGGVPIMAFTISLPFIIRTELFKVI
ncbi:MAG: metal-dependent hydrolase [Promethearchaeota archaeon]